MVPGMARDYRCDFINTAAGTMSTAIIRCDNDDQARLKAFDILAKAAHYDSVRIWDGGRRVDSEEPSNPPRDATST